MYSRRWLHSHVTGQEAEKLLMDQGYDGSFLVRPSHSVQGNFTLSVRRRNEVTHIKIQNTGDYYDLYGGDKFASLAELVQHYTETHGQLKEKTGVIIALKYPLFTADPTNERWFHGLISGKIAEKKLLNKARFGSYLIRASISKPGDFVLSVRGENHCTHIMILSKDGKFEIGGGMLFDTLGDLIEYYKDNPMVEAKPSGNVVHLKQPFNATSITASGISSRIFELEKENSLDKSQKQGYFEEFEQLGQMEGKHLQVRKEGKRECNKQKNRYKNILPFDYSRVILSSNGDSSPGSDYINANKISNQDIQNGRQYIATQGCLPSTVGDFWRMVYQENTLIIAMTTKLVERAKNKCEKYWPDLNSTSHFTINNGILKVSCIKEGQQDNHNVREFTLMFIEKGDKCEKRIHHVWQYHFITWPDHGAPNDPGSVLSFLQEINTKQSSFPNAGPIIVHCSAGIGRTGTIIVIDMILQQIKSEGLNCEIDVQQMVHMIRSQRSGMVQTEHQYRFIYRAVKHHIDTTMQRMHADMKKDSSFKNVSSDKDSIENVHHFSIPVNKSNQKSNSIEISNTHKNQLPEAPPILYENLSALSFSTDAPIVPPRN